jgi:hypothetical protein
VKQSTRLAILLTYLVALFAASRVAHGSWLPPTSEKGLWFYSGLAALLLGRLLVTPFFTKPVDAVSYSVAALVALLAVRAKATGDLVEAAWLATTFFAVAILSTGIACIAFKDYAPRFARSLYAVTDTLGAPRVVFSSLFGFALFAFNRSSFKEFFTVGVAWAALVALRPLETAADLVSKVRGISDRAGV